LTDPSYRGQGVLFTVSHIGNVGINLEDDESAKPQVSAAVIRSLSPVVSNWRSALSLSEGLLNTTSLASAAWTRVVDSQTPRWRHAKKQRSPQKVHLLSIVEMSRDWEDSMA